MSSDAVLVAPIHPMAEGAAVAGEGWFGLNARAAAARHRAASPESTTDARVAYRAFGPVPPARGGEALR